MIDYTYQIRAAEITLENALDEEYLAAVLAVCPGGGKTTISHHIINKYLERFPNARVLVLTEGQNVLKIQYLQELKNPNISIDFTFGDFISNAQVRVGLPQSIDQLKWKEVDLLVVDEAHNFYLADMVQHIIKKLNIKHKVLMTGSPTKYNLHNQTNWETEYGMYYISGEDLIDKGVFSSVDLDVVKTRDKKDPVQTIKDVFSYAKKEKVNLSKVMIACPGIEYSKTLSKYLSENGRKVSLSTSEDLKGDIEIENFKNNKTDVLIVVNKGILGFNDKEITTLIDLKGSKNIDVGYQLFARVLRTHPKDIKKNYLRVSDNDYNEQAIVLHKIISLIDRKNFMYYNGKNIIRYY